MADMYFLLMLTIFKYSKAEEDPLDTPAPSYRECRDSWQAKNGQNQTMNDHDSTQHLMY